MRILVIGAGAMGNIYGSRLSTCNDVTLIDTNQSIIDKINRDGVILEENGELHHFSPKAQSHVDNLGADLIILFTKALYSFDALNGVKSAIGEDTYLMTLQNGAGHEKLLSSFVGLDHIIIGTTEDNGAVIERGKIHHGGSGVTNIGMLDKRDTSILERIKTSFDAAGFDVRIHDNIEQLIWDKLMTNTSLSILTAILGCDMSYISSNDYARHLCEKLIEEAVSVANGMNLSFDYYKVREKVLRTSANNKGGYTSIMMDIKNGRRTEVDTISGAVKAKAEELGIPVPYHDMAISLVHALEEKA